MKAYLVAINSKYIHPAMGVFSLVSNSNYPVIYDEFTIKDKKEKRLIWKKSIYLYHYLLC